MPGYFKTQWWRLLLGLACFIYSIVIICISPQPDVSTVDGVYICFKDAISCLAWFLAGCLWFVMSFIEHNSNCVKALEKRMQKLEERAITDIDTIGPNNFMVRRRLGPDKDVPPPPPKSGSNIEKPRTRTEIEIKLSEEKMARTFNEIKKLLECGDYEGAKKLFDELYNT